MGVLCHRSFEEEDGYFYLDGSVYGYLDGNVFVIGDFYWYPPNVLGTAL